MAVNPLVRASVASAWDAVSEAYQQRYAIPAEHVHLGPMVPTPDQLGIDVDAAGLRVLDFGCGGGQNAVACARAGASAVIALDPSVRQLEYGRELARRHDVEVDFRLLDETSLAAVEPVDLVVSVYALQFVADLESVFAGLRSCLRPGGRLVVSVDHPLRVAGEWDAQGDFRLTDYLATGWQSWGYAFPEADVEVTMARFRRTVQDWVRALLSAGLRLTDLREPGPPALDDEFGIRSRHGVRDPRNVFDRRHLERIPGSLLLVAENDAGPDRPDRRSEGQR